MTILVDSDVLIWFTRGHPGAEIQLRSIMPWYISAVTYMELVQGCRNKAELERLKKGLTQRSTEILPLTPAITQRAILLVENYSLSNGLQLADALIAATALEHKFTLLTANIKHFGSIENVQIERFEPGKND